MASNFFNRFIKKTQLLPQNQIDIDQYNNSLQKLKEIEVSFNAGEVTEALKNIALFYNEVTSTENPIPLLIFDSLLLYLKILLYKSNFDLIEKLLTDNNQLISLIKGSKEESVLNKYLNYKFLLFNYYIRKGDSSKINSLASQLKNELESTNDNFTKSKIMNHLALLDIVQNSFSLAIEKLEKSNEFINEAGNKYLSMKILNNLGLAYLHTGNLEKASSNLSESLQLSQQLNEKVLENIIKNNVGIYNIFTGDTSSASSLLEETLDFYQQNDLNLELANTYINLSSISDIRGEIVQAQSDLTSAIDLTNSIGNNYYKFVCSNNLADIAFITGEFESAKNTYLECYNYFKSHNHFLESVYTLFNLLSLAILESDFDKKAEYLNDISEIKEKALNPLINLIFDISRGLDLKQYDRMVKKAEAQQIFTNIASTSNLFNEFKVIALKNLCELLLEELSESGEQEVIDELKQVLIEIQAIADKQNSLELKVEGYLIQSKIDLLESKLNESRSLLSLAQTLAEEKGLTALSLFVSREYDNLLNQIAKLDQSHDQLSKMSMNERLQIAELEGMVNKIIRKRADITELKEESPFMFLIIAMSGMSIFSKIFVDQDLMDEQLIGGFITAINIVTQQAFSDQDAIEGIRHQDFTLLLKYIGSTRILCVYVFKGQTYFAMQKLKTFIETVQYSEAMSRVDEANEFGEIISEEPALLDLVTKIFQETSEESLELAQKNAISQKISATINPGLLIDDVPLF